MIERLRQAKHLSVGLGHAESMPVSFELAHLFATPIQPNIDHCGNHAEPDWRPITDAPRVEQELGAYYGVLYREWNGFLRDSHVKTIAIDSAPAAAGSPFTLLMTCNSRVLTFQLERLPDVGNPTSIRLRLDGGDPFEVPVSVFDIWDGTTLVALNPDLDALRQGTTLQFEIGTDRQARGTFNLAELFGTPIQTNFDNCKRDYWSSPPTYIPVVAQRERLSRVLVYSAYQEEDSTVSSGVWTTAVDAPKIDGTFEMQATCYSGSVSQALIETPLEVDAGQVSVSLTVDGRSFGSTLWHKEQVGSFGLLVHPSPRQLMAQLRGASVAVMEVPELASVPITFDVSGMFDTPVQANLDECGYYKPGEVRSLPLPLNVFGVSSMPNADDGVAEVIAWLRIPGSPTIVQTDLLAVHRRVDEPSLGLIMTCGPSGVSMSIYGERTSELDGNHLRVQWRTDGGAVHQALWQVAHFSTGSTQVSPELASEVISSWRNASELELTLLDAVPSSHRFNLDALFDNPVADTFDECLTMPIPPQSPPVTGIPLTFDTHLTYAADLFHGSSWITSFVELLDNSPLPDRADDIDTRSELSVFCRIDGISVRVSKLDAMQPVFVAGDTVEVTWNIDGRSHTEMWDVWSTFNYHDISPPDDAGFYAALKGAATVTIRVASDPVITKSVRTRTTRILGHARPTKPRCLQRRGCSLGGRTIAVSSRTLGSRPAPQTGEVGMPGSDADQARSHQDREARPDSGLHLTLNLGATRVVRLTDRALVQAQTERNLRNRTDPNSTDLNRRERAGVRMARSLPGPALATPPKACAAGHASGLSSGGTGWPRPDGWARSSESAMC